MKIKVITVNYVDNLQEKIDEFMESIPGIEVISTQLFSTCMHDKYHTGEICNQWQEHTFTIVYKG